MQIVISLRCKSSFGSGCHPHNEKSFPEEFLFFRTQQMVDIGEIELRVTKVAKNVQLAKFVVLSLSSQNYLTVNFD